jgi:hypothetical protein
MLGLLRSRFESVPEHRTGRNIQYAIRDAGLSAFAVFFMQAPSFLAHQRDMQRALGRNNANSLFGPHAVPSAPQIRNLLDPLAPEPLQVPYWEILAGLEAAGQLARYRSFAGNWLCALDGAAYFASSEIHCPRCSMRIVNGQPHYAHTAITPVLVAPGEPRVITLEPEFITPQDGQEKQDCERHAAKRWLVRHAARFAGHPVTYLGDDLPKVQSTLLRATLGGPAPQLHLHVPTRLPWGFVHRDRSARPHRGGRPGRRARLDRPGLSTVDLSLCQ